MPQTKPDEAAGGTKPTRSKKLKRAIKRLVQYTALATLWAGAAAGRALGRLPKRRAHSGQRITVINLTPHVGDTVLLLPLLEMLRAEHPEAWIECIVDVRAAALLQTAPVNKVRTMDLGGGPPRSVKESIQRVLGIWRQAPGLGVTESPDVCLSVRWGDDLFRSTVLAFLLAQACGLVPVEAPLNQGALPAMQALAATVDRPALLARLGVTQPFAALAPGASMAKKTWQAERWAAVARELINDGLQVVLLSGKGDRETAEAVQKLVPGSVLVAGVTTLVESTALLSEAALFAGPDSGPGHMAGALGTPTITLYIALPQVAPDAPWAPERIHPLGSRTTWLVPRRIVPPCELWCTADEPHCILEITETDVLDAARKLLQ